MEKEEPVVKFLKQRINRRQAIKVGGLATLGLVFSKPLIEAIRPMPAFAGYDDDGKPPKPPKKEK
jgi:hypothetical protein